MIEKCGSIFYGKTNITSSKTRRNKSINYEKIVCDNHFGTFLRENFICEQNLKTFVEQLEFLKITIYLSYILSRITILFYVQNTDKAKIVATPL